MDGLVMDGLAVRTYGCGHPSEDRKTTAPGCNFSAALLYWDSERTADTRRQATSF